MQRKWFCSFFWQECIGSKYSSCAYTGTNYTCMFLDAYILYFEPPRIPFLYSRRREIPCKYYDTVLFPMNEVSHCNAAAKQVPSQVPGKGVGSGWVILDEWVQDECLNRTAWLAGKVWGSIELMRSLLCLWWMAPTLDRKRKVHISMLYATSRQEPHTSGVYFDRSALSMVYVHSSSTQQITNIGQHIGH